MIQPVVKREREDAQDDVVFLPLPDDLTRVPLLPHRFEDRSGFGRMGNEHVCARVVENITQLLCLDSFPQQKRRRKARKRPLLIRVHS